MAYLIILCKQVCPMCHESVHGLLILQANMFEVIIHSCLAEAKKILILAVLKL